MTPCRSGCGPYPWLRILCVDNALVGSPPETVSDERIAHEAIKILSLSRRRKRPTGEARISKRTMAVRLESLMLPAHFAVAAAGSYMALISVETWVFSQDIVNVAEFPDAGFSEMVNSSTGELNFVTFICVRPRSLEES